ncbi:MAG: hypothetical protein JSV82_00845 [Planctomycetota bacterium]|nr:MAG: hypothetical protein JSV82_00845 [Planctomycetota bacterium]
MILNSFAPYIAGAAMLASLAAGYKIRDWQCDAALAKALERAAKQQQEIRDELDKRSRAYETLRSQADGMGTARATDIRTIYREVPAPAPSCSAPDSVVSVLQSGVDNANAAATGQSGE